MNAPIKHRPAAESLPLPDVRPGHDEKNLAQFPLALLAKRAPTGLDTIEYSDDYPDPQTGKVIKRKVTITGAGRYGLPTNQDEDVLIALLYLTLVNKQPHQLQDNDRTVYFTRRQLLEILGWPDTGDYYERLRKALRRWKGVSIIYENWWDNAAGKPRSGETGFSLLDNYQLSDSRRKDKEQQLLFPDVAGQSRAQCYIVWNKTPFASFQNGYLKQLDLDKFFCLPTAAAKRAYRYLDADLPDHGPREYDLHTFACEHVGLARSYKPSRLRDEVQKTIVVPLEQADVIEPLPPARRFFKRDRRYKVLLGRKQSQVMTAPPPTLPIPSPAAPDHEPNPQLLAELRQRKLGGKLACDFLASYPAEYLQQKIDYYDFELERGRMERPVAWLRRAIEEDYGEPAGYLPRQERERQRQAAEENERRAAEARRLEQEQRSAELRQRQREETERAHVEARLKLLSPEEYKQLEEQALANADGKTREHARGEDPLSRIARRMLVHREVLRRFPLSPS